ncbi:MULTISPECIES: type VI secretion system TssO [unclassified Myroides]|uniref:type VI secretion system TssO n=1 Tax=unclassified Myroides TaxID=2642485 RepID=UPI003D2F697A
MYLKIENIKHIYLKLLYFIANFLFLILICFLSIYFFFETSDRQFKQVERGVIFYKNRLNQQYVLKNKVDTLYYHMRLLNTGKVEHNHFLKQYISKEIVEIKNLLKENNTDNFNCYEMLLTQLDSILLLKAQLIQIGNKESLALKDLNECMFRFKTVYTELMDDPNRK